VEWATQSCDGRHSSRTHKSCVHMYNNKGRKSGGDNSENIKKEKLK
jgi:hypothetical protein